VDHAVASGLFLFRYSTFWFWIAKRSGFKGSFAVFKDDGYPKGDVVCACFAAGAHNIIGVHAQDIDPLVFDKNPLLYLGVLCDELQKWDRFPAGERHLVDLISFEKYCTDSERISVEGGWDGNEVILRFEEEELASGIKKALTRLDSVENFIKINPASPDADAVESEESTQEANAPPTPTPPPTE